MIGNVALIRRRVWRQTIIAGMTGLLLGSFCGCALIVWGHQYDPVIIREERMIDGQARPNGHIDLYVELDRLRDCPSETSRWLWTWVERDGQRTKRFYPLLSTTTTLSNIGHDQHFILSIPVPGGVTPGDWFYWSKTAETCLFPLNLLHNAIQESSDIPVQIVGPTP